MLWVSVSKLKNPISRIFFVSCGIESLFQDFEAACHGMELPFMFDNVSQLKKNDDKALLAY